MTRVTNPITFEVRELADHSLETPYGQAGYDLVFDEISSRIIPEQFQKVIAGAACFAAIQPQTERLLGVAYLHVGDTSFIDMPVAFLDYLAVMGTLQRGGHRIGSTLLKTCEARAIDQGMKCMLLDPSKKAWDFYEEKHGYHFRPDLNLMEKRLGKRAIPEVIFPY